SYCKATLRPLWYVHHMELLFSLMNTFPYGRPRQSTLGFQNSGGDHEMAAHQSAVALAKSWKSDPRWNGVARPYSAEDVVRLRGTLHIEHTLARLGAERLWELLRSEKYVNALGAMSGNQAVQMVGAGLKAI